MSSSEEKVSTQVEDGQPRSPGMTRRTVSRVEFRLASARDRAKREAREASSKHDWNPDCVPASSSLLVRTSLACDEAEPSGATHSATQHHAPSHTPPSLSHNSTPVRHPNSATTSAYPVDNSPDLGAAISVSSQGSPLHAEQTATPGREAQQTYHVGPRAPPQVPSETAGSTASRAVGTAGGGEGGEQPVYSDLDDHRSERDGSLCAATGKRPSCIEGGRRSTDLRNSSTIPRGTLTSAGSLIGAEREDVFVDDCNANEPSPVHAQEEDDGEAREVQHSGTPTATATTAASATEDQQGQKMIKGMKAGTARTSSGGRPGKRSGVPSARSSVSPPNQRRSTLPSLPAKERKHLPSTTPAGSARAPQKEGSRTGSSSAINRGRADSSRAAPARTPSPDNGRSRSRSRSRSRASLGDRPPLPASGRRTSDSPSATEKALRSINYTAFTSSSVKPKARRAKMVSELLAAHQRGASEIAAEWEKHFTTCYHRFVQDSFDPHRRELLRLVDYVHVLRRDCKEKLDFAASTCNNALDGVEGLLATLQEAGLELSTKTQVLSFLGQKDGSNSSSNSSSGNAGTCGNVGGQSETMPPAWKQISVPAAEYDAEGNILAKGHVMAEARDADAAWREAESHPAARLLPQAEIDKAAAIKAFFASTLEKLRHEAVELSLPPKMGEMGPENRENLLRLKQEEATQKARRAAEALALKGKLEELASASAGLLQRLQHQFGAQEARIAGLQRALDEGCTRRKLADDVLRGCLEQESEEAAFSFARVKELEMQLRARVDAVEGEVRAALDQLIHESTSVCVASRTYKGAFAGVNYDKDSCVKVFALRMEQSAKEQADVLREAQQVMQRLWQSAAAHRPGREEKRTLLHRAFPAAYEDMLQRCDRDTLLRLIHHLSLQSSEMTRCLMSALQEHEKFLRSNAAEVVALKEQEDRHVAVSALLEKMYEDSRLHDRPHQRMAADGTLLFAAHDGISSSDGELPPPESGGDGASAQRAKAPLSEIVANMAQRYNEMMGFEETYARALARQREALAKELSPQQRSSFFDKEVPVPTSASPSSSATREARCTLPADSEGSLIPLPRGESGLSSSPSPSGEEGVDVGRAVAFLQQSNPSLLARVGGDVASVVGEGRWGGRTPARASAFRGTYSDGTPFVVTGAARDYASLTSSLPSVPPLRQQQHPPPPPPPGVPLRKDIVFHVLSSYSNTVEQLTAVPAADTELPPFSSPLSADGGAAVASPPPPPPPPPARCKRAFDNHDLPYLLAQRQVVSETVGGGQGSSPPKGNSGHLLATI